MNKDEASRFLAKTAMLNFEHLASQERIKLMHAMALVLPEKEAQAASQSAFLLEKAEQQQLTLKILIQ